MFLKVSPHSSQYRAEDVLYIDTDKHPTGGLALESSMQLGKSFDNEDIFKDRIADAKMEDYGTDEESATNAVHEEVGEEWVELLNYVLHATGKEVSERCTFELVEEMDEEEEL